MLNPTVFVINSPEYEIPPGNAPADFDLGRPASDGFGIIYQGYGGTAQWRVYTYGPGGVSALSNAVVVTRNQPPDTSSISVE